MFHSPSRPARGRHCAAGLVAALMLAATAATAATRDPAGLCDAAASRAAAATGVPLAVLRAIALTESGRRRDGQLRPWPWATNVEGQGRWFDSRAAAEAHARAELDRGRRSIDIGCFQVNHRWHGTAFASLEAMFEPEANALHAARFLAGLQRELGSWEAAAGAYHSRTPALADRYTARFRTHLAALETGSETAPPPHPTPDVAQPRRPPDYPLLHAGASAGLGSLVPLGSARGSLIASTARALR